MLACFSTFSEIWEQLVFLSYYLTPRFPLSYILKGPSWLSKKLEHSIWIEFSSRLFWNRIRLFDQTSSICASNSKTDSYKWVKLIRLRVNVENEGFLVTKFKNSIWIYMKSRSGPRMQLFPFPKGQCAGRHTKTGKLISSFFKMRTWILSMRKKVIILSQLTHCGKSNEAPA